MLYDIEFKVTDFEVPAGHETFLNYYSEIHILFNVIAASDFTVDLGNPTMLEGTEYGCTSYGLKFIASYYLKCIYHKGVDYNDPPKIIISGYECIFFFFIFIFKFLNF